MKILFTLCVLLFSSSVLAEDISDFEIEGMSVGDSLLDYMSEEKIKTELKENRYMYEYTATDDFGEVYLSSEGETYDQISFFVKTVSGNKFISKKNSKDGKFIIYRISGIISYIEDLNGCLKKQNEIAREFSVILKNTKKTEQSFDHAIDPSGRSSVKKVVYNFDTADQIQITCIDFEENLRVKNNWTEGLRIDITTKEVNEWLKTRKN